MLGKTRAGIEEVTQSKLQAKLLMVLSVAMLSLAVLGVFFMLCTGQVAATTSISDSMDSLWEIFPMIIDLMILGLILGLLAKIKLG